MNELSEKKSDYLLILRFLVFSWRILPPGKKSFPREKISAQYPAEKKRKDAIFAWFQNWRRKSLENISIQKFFFFGRNIFLKFSLQILEPAKNFMFSFFFCWVFTECFWEDDDLVILFILSKGLSGKKSF